MPSGVFISPYEMSGFGGGIQLSRAFFSAIRAWGEGWHWTIVCPTLKDDRFRENTYVDVVGLPRRSRLFAIRQLIRGESYDRLSPKTDQLLMQQKFDLIVVNGTKSGRFCAPSFSRSAKVVALHHNFETDYYRDTLHRFAFPLVARAVSSNQRCAWKHADLNLFLSKSDLDQCRKAFGETRSRCEVMGVFDEQNALYRPLESCSGSRALTLVTTGRFDIKQARGGVQWFLDEVWADTRLAFPGITLKIAGRDVPAEWGVHSGVELINRPASIDSIVWSSDIYLAPTRDGSGVKIKVLDALRSGLPVIAHPVSAVGYETLADSAVYCFRDSVSFIDIVARLQVQRLESEDWAHRVRSTYQQQFSWEAGVARVATLLNDGC